MTFFWHSISMSLLFLRKTLTMYLHWYVSIYQNISVKAAIEQITEFSDQSINVHFDGLNEDKIKKNLINPANTFSHNNLWTVF